jgi:metal-responsive CopG/Arc/MetJ family transcriptional regulator
MPNKPRRENRHRMVRVEDDLWEAAKDAAAANDTTVSEIIRDALRRYVKKHQAQSRRKV